MCVESIYIPINTEDSDYLRCYEDFTDKKKHQFDNIFKFKTQYYRKIDIQESELCSNLYIFTILDWIPFYCNSTHDILVRINSVNYECHFIWFFGWHKIYGPLFHDDA